MRFNAPGNLGNEIFLARQAALKATCTYLNMWAGFTRQTWQDGDLVSLGRTLSACQCQLFPGKPTHMLGTMCSVQWGCVAGLPRLILVQYMYEKIWWWLLHKCLASTPNYVTSVVAQLPTMSPLQCVRSRSAQTNPTILWRVCATNGNVCNECNCSSNLHRS